MVTREQPVSHQMLRSLCGCRTNQVDDKNEIVIRDYRDTVFVYTSHNVLSRSLVGALLSSLEKTNLKMVEAMMLKPSQEIVKIPSQAKSFKGGRSCDTAALIKKSAILKKVGRHSQSQSEVCLISLWRGDDSFKRVQHALARFCREYAFVECVDIVMTESTKATRKEAELWIIAPVPTPPPVVVIAENNVIDPAQTANEQPPNLEEENAAAEVDAAIISPNVVQDPEDVILVRDSSTADTMPVDNKSDEPPPQALHVLKPDENELTPTSGATPA